ncbi:uncharacterized protein LOC143079071 isoform X2 [Mytilus galloprovincialis]|uniref:uncharacterized protein LOC143079071 isoform X2 n=1 Tax=Mytilus galloprovincialis TaxID=29158 RepID=UPI003F7BF96F
MSLLQLQLPIGFIIAMPTSQAQAQAHGEDMKKLKEDLRRMEDLWRSKEDVSRKEKKKLLSLLAIIIGVVIVPCIGLSINNMIRLNEYDLALEHSNEFTKLIDGLKEIMRDVPHFKDTLTDVGRRIDVIKIFISGAKHDVESIRKELESMNSTDKRVKDIESSVSLINKDYFKLKQLSDNQREQLEGFNTSIETTKSQIDSLLKNADAANSTLAPIIQNQTELFKNITDSNVRMLEINDSVNSMTLRLSKVTKNVTDLQPQLEIAGKAAAKMTEMHEGVDQLETEIINVNSIMSTLNLKMKITKSAVSKTATKVDELSSGVSGYEKELKTLQNKQSDVNTNIEKTYESTKQLEIDVSNAKIRFDVLQNEVTESGNKVENIKSEIDEAASKVQKEMWFCNVSIDTLNETIANLSKEVSSNATYIEKTLPTLVSIGQTLQTLDAFPWMSVVSVVDVLFVLVVIVVYLNNHHWNVEHSQKDLPQNPNGNGHERRQGNVRPQSILDRTHRFPVLDNKVCVLSFYSETMNLHKQLVESALATRRRKHNIIQYLVRRHEDILNIPPARYIFVFVDFNERNVILENPGQDLGDKKLVTVQAAQKIGADVFVTYVRDRGSNQLVPGNLYNQELFAFTSHHVLRTLENKQRCFSVYETFNNTQKDSIVRSIS